MVAYTALSIASCGKNGPARSVLDPVMMNENRMMMKFAIFHGNSGGN